MGVDAEMFVRLAEPISDDQLIDAAYRLAEAVSGHPFHLSNDESGIRIWGPNRRALNRVSDDDYLYNPVEKTDQWIGVSLAGRYYGVGYERGDLWTYVQIARWLLHNFHGSAVFYGGDSGTGLTEWTPDYEQELIRHWATEGHRPYYQSDGWVRNGPTAPLCPLCRRAATQYGSGAKFASWTCDACGQHWLWVGGAIHRYDASESWDSFKAAEALREEEQIQK